MIEYTGEDVDVSYKQGYKQGREDAIDDFLEVLYFVFDVKAGNKTKINEIAENIKRVEE